MKDLLPLMPACAQALLAIQAGQAKTQSGLTAAGARLAMAWPKGFARKMETQVGSQKVKRDLSNLAYLRAARKTVTDARTATY
jgi:hypothetical protein